jgi:hypothetical protein
VKTKSAPSKSVNERKLPKRIAKSLDLADLQRVHGGGDSGSTATPAGSSASGTIPPPPIPGEEMQHNETLVRVGAPPRPRKPSRGSRRR